MTDRSSLRLFVLRVLVVALLATLFGRLWYLQVYAGEQYAEAAAANRVRTVVTTAPRGEVLDARGRELVRNRTALVVSVSRSTLLRQADDGAAVLARLGTVVGKDPRALAQAITPCGGSVEPPCWRGSPYQPVPVAEYDASDRAALTRVLRIEERREDFPGVTVGPSAVRDYPRGDLAAHLLGYLGPVSPEEARERPGLAAASLVGRAGVEATYDEQLRGRDGQEQLLVDRLGAVTGTKGRTPPQPGDRLVLSIDADVQAVAERALRRGIDRARGLRARGSGEPLVADSGSVVVMEASTGRVVAMASYPSYDPAVFVGGASPAEYAQLVDETRGAPLVFRAIQGAYAPASTFKVISTVAAVDSGDYPLRGRYPCPGVYGPTGQSNFDSAPLGTVDLRRALVKSCDTVFYKFAYEQWQRDGGNDPVDEPRDPMVRTAQAFGLGERTGVDLPSERRGTIADRAYKQRLWEQTRAERCKGTSRADREFCEDGNRFRGGDATNFSIGQGDTLVTPLQLATVYAAVANGGKVLEPHVARALVSPSGQVREVPVEVRSTVPVDPDVLGYVREALSGVTEPGGTAAAAFAGSSVDVAGKTGTGEVAGKQDTSWFASFAPAAAPELVVVGLVSQGGTGGTVAAPMVREVYEGIYGPGGTGLVRELPELQP